ncbi:MAG: hypothetical protein M3O22_06485, partial [Pseudomonadota bacterium]|nr:hypothetical protein [Pseudomonadota bacterium]
ILNFARIESGKIEYREQQVDLRVLMRELQAVKAPQPTAKKSSTPNSRKWTAKTKRRSNLASVKQIAFQ